MIVYFGGYRDGLLDGFLQYGEMDLNWYILLNERTDLVFLIGFSEVFRYGSLDAIPIRQEKDLDLALHMELF